jgi:hypothetical protein
MATMRFAWFGWCLVLVTAVVSLPATAADKFDPAAYEAALTALDGKRAALFERFGKARGAVERTAIRVEARQTVLAAITDTIFPAWMGTPWGLGEKSMADRPHQAGMVVGCSYFVTGVLLNAGLRLSSRALFAQAPSLLMQQALAPDRAALHRYPGQNTDVLIRRLLALGDGVYIVGLNIHTGFLVIKDGKIHVVHASYTPPNQVLDEPFDKSDVITLSKRRGYVVTPIFQDDRLVDFWLSGRAVPAPDWKPRRDPR